MYMRIFSAVFAVIALAACSKDPQAGDGAAAEQPPAAVLGGVPVRSVPCAVNGVTRYAQECAVESVSEDGRTVLIVRHPDGGFRRLEEIDGGKSYRSADGADTAVVTIDKDKLAVAIDEDHYLFPLPAEAKPEPAPVASGAAGPAGASTDAGAH